MTLDDAVEMEHLPGGDFKRPVPAPLRDSIHQEPLLRVANPSGHSGTNREHIGRSDTLSLTLISDAMVVPSVDSVELGEFPQLRLPKLVSGSVSWPSLSRLAIVVRVFGFRPVVAVSYGKGGEL